MKVILFELIFISFERNKYDFGEYIHQIYSNIGEYIHQIYTNIGE